MAEGVLYSFAEGILQRLASEVVNEIGLVWGVKEKLLDLEDTMSMIKEVLLDAQEQRINRRHIKNWLSRLEDVVQDFEDLLDYMETDDALQRQRRSNKCPLIKEVRNFFSSSNRVAFRFKMAHWVEDIKKKLAEVQADKKEFQLEVRLEEAPLVASDVRSEQTHSFVPEEEVIGRKHDKSKIINKLLNVDETNENVSTIAIVGCGGMGKTTIAQYVSSDEKVKSHFQLRMWVCVTEVFVVKTIVEQIIKSVASRSPNSCEMDQMQDQLRKELKDKRYLLVLDDVWNDDYSEWHKLRDLLGGGAMGSRILVTTRSTKVANVTGDKKPYDLEKLDDVSSWSLFKKMAFKEGYEGNRSIEDIGKKIIKKCGGIPIVIKTMGSMLRFKNAETEWQQFVDKELSKVPQYADNILPRLELSYNHLPSHLKHCFAYCSLFPKDYKFDVQYMIQYWMALGFVNSSDQSQPPEDVGYEYFKELLSRSFFQQVETNKWGDIISCKMHDFIHDLAIKVAGTECIAFNNSEGRNIGKRTRHVSFDNDHEQLQPFLANLLKAERIRSILTYCLHEPTVNKIISSLKRIRLLDLTCSHIEKVPKSIAKLMHLRYLNLNGSDLTTLPNSLCRLQNLQTLLLYSCKDFHKWPKDLGKLVNLRHLDFSSCKKLTEWPKDMQNLVNLRHLEFEDPHDEIRKSMPCTLSQLTNLQTLSPFEIDVNSIEFGIAQMGELNNLRGGDLKIVNLRHGNNETSKANLKKKKFDSIKLKWLNNVKVDEATATTDETTLEDLQPHQNLKELSLYGYCGNKFPNWFSSLINVVSVDLVNCTNLQSLSQLANLPALKELLLVNLHALKELLLDNLPVLKKLTLEELPALKELPALEELMLNNLLAFEELRLEELPAIKKLRLEELPALKELLALKELPALEELMLEELPALEELMLKELPALKELLIDDLLALKKLRLDNLHALKELRLEGLPALKELIIFDLHALKELIIFYLHDLEELRLYKLPAVEELKLEELPALKKLHLYHLPDLVYISSNNSDELICRSSSSSSKLKSFFPSLKCLILEDMPSLEGWWNINNEDNNHLKLPEFPCLSILMISNCPRLSCMPLFPSLDECLLLEGINWRGALQSTLIMKDIEEGGPQIQNDAKSQNQDSTTTHEIHSSSSSSSSISNMIPPLSKLKQMSLLNIEDLESLLAASKSMISLKHLEIRSCSKLKIPGIQHLTSLQRLEICACNRLSTLPQEIFGLSRSLKQLKIKDCHDFDSLPEEISSLTSLERLDLTNLPKLKSLPQANIQQLNFWYHIDYETRVKEFIKSKPGVFHLQNFTFNIVDCPHLEEFIRNSGFSISFEGPKDYEYF